MALNAQHAHQTNTMIHNIRFASIVQEDKLSINMENVHVLSLYSGLDTVVFNAITRNILTLLRKDA